MLEVEITIIIIGNAPPYNNDYKEGFASAIEIIESIFILMLAANCGRINLPTNEAEHECSSNISIQL